MALTSLDKDNVSRLMESLALTELQDSKCKDLMKYSASCNAKLKVLFEQHKFLQEQALRIMETAVMNKRLHEARCNFIKVCGREYHFYMNSKDEMFCSIIAPHEWQMYKEVVGTFYLDFDNEFVKIT